MKTKKIEEKITKTIFVSEDGKYESRCSADVIQYEKKQALTNSISTFIYKTTTQSVYHSGTQSSEYYVYKCDSEKGLKYAIMDACDKLDYRYVYSQIEKAAKKYQKGITIYAIRIVDSYDGLREIEIKTLDEVISELTKEKEELIKQEQNIYNNILEISKLFCKED